MIEPNQKESACSAILSKKWSELNSMARGGAGEGRAPGCQWPSIYHIGEQPGTELASRVADLHSVIVQTSQPMILDVGGLSKGSSAEVSLDDFLAAL
jgi:hypothetical protein